MLPEMRPKGRTMRARKGAILESPFSVLYRNQCERYPATRKVCPCCEGPKGLLIIAQEKLSVESRAIGKLRSERARMIAYAMTR